MTYHFSALLLSFSTLFLSSSLEMGLAFFSSFSQNFSLSAIRKGFIKSEERCDYINKLFVFISKSFHLADRLFSRNFWPFLLSYFCPNSIRVTAFKRIKDMFVHAQLYYLFSSICRRIASFISLSASTRLIRTAFNFKSLQIFSFSSFVRALAKGFGLIVGFDLIFQRYEQSLIITHCNSINRSQLPPQLSPVLPEASFPQFWKQSIEFSSCGYNHKPSYKTPSKDNPEHCRTCDLGYLEQTKVPFGRYRRGNLHAHGLTRKNRFPYLYRFFINEKPEENLFLREIQDGAIKLFLKSKALFFNTLNGFHPKAIN